MQVAQLHRATEFSVALLKCVPVENRGEGAASHLLRLRYNI